MAMCGPLALLECIYQPSLSPLPGIQTSWRPAMFCKERSEERPNHLAPPTRVSASCHLHEEPALRRCLFLGDPWWADPGDFSKQAVSMKKKPNVVVFWPPLLNCGTPSYLSAVASMTQIEAPSLPGWAGQGHPRVPMAWAGSVVLGARWHLGPSAHM